MYVCRHYLFWQTPVSTPFISCWRKRVFTVVQSSQGVLCIVQERPKIISSSKLKLNKGNSVWGQLKKLKMVLNNISQLKHIQLTKHMHYCIQKIYHVYYTTQWNSIILRKFSHMTYVTKWKMNEGCWHIVRHFCHFLLWRGEFCFDVVGNF